MSHRDAAPEDFVGKTIVAADVSAINIWRLTFSDGSTIAIEVESFGLAGYGMVVCDECAQLTENARDIGESNDESAPE